MTVTLNGFVMLGTTVPEPSKRDNRIYVCSAGWHPDLGLVRVYPLGRKSAPRRWSLNTIEVERNPQDSRAESWRIAGDRTAWDVNTHFRHTGEVRKHNRDMILDDKRIPRSIAEANERRASLAIIQPEHIGFDVEHNPDSPDSPQLALFADGLPPREGARRFPYIPRLIIDGDAQRNLQIRDWGAFEFMRKYPGREREIPQALHLGPSSVLLVGNLNQHRTVWVVISVLNIASRQLTLDGAA